MSDMLLNGEQLRRTTVFARQCWRRLCGVADHTHRIQGPERRETTCRGRSARTVDVKARSPLQTETATFPRRLSTRSRREPLWFQLPDANSLSSFIPDKSESGRPDSASGPRRHPQIDSGASPMLRPTSGPRCPWMALEG